MARIRDFGKGALTKGSNVVASTTQQIKTSMVSMPKTKYGQRGKRK